MVSDEPAIVRALRSLLAEQKKVGVISTHPSLQYPDELLANASCATFHEGRIVWDSEKINSNVFFITLGDENHLDKVAQGIFAVLRELDVRVDVILLEGVEEKNEGLAVMNRMRKAANSIREW